MSTLRYEWPAEALYGQRHAVPSSPAPEPQMAGLDQQRGNSAPLPNAPVPVANGYWNRWQWAVTRRPDVLHPLVTIQGFYGPHWYTHTQEMPGASPAKVKRLVEATQARLGTDAAKKRGKGQR